MASADPTTPAGQCASAEHRQKDRIAGNFKRNSNFIDHPRGGEGDPPGDEFGEESHREIREIREDGFFTGRSKDQERGVPLSP
jgi:hypothetical protein